MGAVTVVFYRDEQGIPVLKWLEGLPEEVYTKGHVRIERLGELVYELRRPETDYLGNDIYELRWRLGHVNYRLLYFFHGRNAVVLAHGLTKEERVPEKDINLAIERKRIYLDSPEEHAYYDEELQ